MFNYETAKIMSQLLLHLISQTLLFQITISVVFDGLTLETTEEVKTDLSELFSLKLKEFSTNEIKSLCVDGKMSQIIMVTISSLSVLRM